CANHPRIIAMYGTSWKINDSGDADANTNSRSATHAPAVDHWISFTLTEPGDVEGLRCVAHFADGSRAVGTFDGKNTVRFERGDNASACRHVELKLDSGVAGSSSITQLLLDAARA